MRQAPKGLSIAIGGHATLKPGAIDKSIPAQEAAMEETLNLILKVVQVALVENYTWNTLTHGSGPQTDLIMKRVRECLSIGMHNIPLHYASMDLIASIGMTMARILNSALAREAGCLGEGKTGAVVVPTHFLVDPTTMQPVKPIGSPLNEKEERILTESGETITIGDVDGKGRRILVASPKVLETLPQDLTAIAAIIRAGLLGIVGGTGGIAVTRGENGEIIPHPAVIDKDNAARQIIQDLANEGVSTDTHVIITDADFMVENFSVIMDAIRKAGGDPKNISAEDRARLMQAAGPIHHIAVADMLEILEKKGAVSGGARPKIQSACDLVNEEIVRQAIICSPGNFRATFIGKAEDQGTVIFKGATWQ